MFLCINPRNNARMLAKEKHLTEICEYEKRLGKKYKKKTKASLSEIY